MAVKLCHRHKPGVSQRAAVQSLVCPHRPPDAASRSRLFSPLQVQNCVELVRGTIVGGPPWGPYASRSADVGLLGRGLSIFRLRAPSVRWQSPDALVLRPQGEHPPGTEGSSPDRWGVKSGDVGRVSVSDQIMWWGFHDHKNGEKRAGFTSFCLRKPHVLAHLKFSNQHLHD